MSRQSHRQFLASSADAALQLLDGDVAAALALAQRRFQATFLHAPVGIAHVALDGSFLLVNPRFCDICGHDADTLIRTGFQQITHLDDLNSDEALLARLRAGEIPRYAMEKRYIRADGSMVWVNMTVAMVRDETGRPEFYVSVIEDLSELRRASFEAMHDPLTGVLNRRGLGDRAREVVAEAERTGRVISLLFLDLDGFKQVNDNHGHAAGDACLVAIARLLESHSGGTATVARIGGDEFLILAATRDEEAARLAAEALRAKLATDGYAVSGSFGQVIAEAAEPFDLDRLIARADSAMLAAKRAGKNQIMIG
ncbi:MAG: diguanylate cyclase [Sphingobium sp.]